MKVRNKTEKINKNIILAGLLILIAFSIYYMNSMRAAGNTDQLDKETLNENDENIIEGRKVVSDYVVDEEAIKHKEQLYKKAPELRGISGYINANESIGINELKGKVVLVDFWTYTCINCIRTLPYLKSWHEQYADDGLVIIGVHTPEFTFEEKYENVKNAVERYELKYPVVQDNDYATWRAYQNRFWPHKYLIGIDGFIRYDHIGEGAYEETEEVIKDLLKERMERLKQKSEFSEEPMPDERIDVDFSKIGTPEIYLGYKFTRGNFGNKEGLQPNKVVDYEIPSIVKPNNVYLDGKWKINEGNSELISDEGRIILGYDAKAVNIVASSESGSEVEVLVDTKFLNESKAGYDIEIVGSKSKAKISEERLYNLVNYEYGQSLLELRIEGKGFKIYTFTFG